MTEYKKPNRYLRNFLLDPNIQIRFSGYIVSILLIFSLSIITYSYFSIMELKELIISSPGMTADSSEQIKELIEEFFYGFLSITGLFTICSAFFVIIQTHKIAGAKYSIIRTIQQRIDDPSSNVKIVLRDSDFLQDLAEIMNKFLDQKGK